MFIAENIHVKQSTTYSLSSPTPKNLYKLLL